MTDSHGNVSEINGLAGSVEGNFENAVSMNGKAVRLSGASSIKVTSNGEIITEISNVASDLVTTDDLEEVFGDFSEGLTVNGVFVKVTDSTNFVVENDDENIYIETTAADTFTINGKTFETFADKTIFKLDASNSNGTNTLAGNDNDNIICAGRGNASLWGGNGNDLLIGGKAHNLFFYTSSNDTISGANDGDAVILSNVTLEQISSTDFTASGVAINFAGGGSLTIDSRADVTYQLADGLSFSANHEQAVWLSK